MNNNIDLYTILFKLVKLKEYKDTFGKDDYYENLQPLLWQEARKVLDETYPNYPIKSIDSKTSKNIEKINQYISDAEDEIQAISGIPAQLFEKIPLSTVIRKGYGIPKPIDYYEKYKKTVKRFKIFSIVFSVFILILFVIAFYLLSLINY